MNDKGLKRYYKRTLSSNNLSPKQKQRWHRWLNKEKARASHHNYKTSLNQRIYAKWWSINNRHFDSLNKQRTNTKNFILKKASASDLDKIRKWLYQAKSRQNK